MDRRTYERQQASKVDLQSTARSAPGLTGGYQQNALKLSLGRRTSGDISEGITAATGDDNYFITMGGEVTTRGGESILVDAVNGTKRRIVTDLNINLKSADVSAKLSVVRRNANGSPTVTSAISLKRFNSMGAYQENKYTIDGAIFLDDGDSLRMYIDNGTAAEIVVDVDGTYELIGS